MLSMKIYTIIFGHLFDYGQVNIVRLISFCIRHLNPTFFTSHSLLSPNDVCVMNETKYVVIS